MPMQHSQRGGTQRRRRVTRQPFLPETATLTPPLADLYLTLSFPSLRRTDSLLLRATASLSEPSFPARQEELFGRDLSWRMFFLST